MSAMSALRLAVARPEPGRVIEIGFRLLGWCAVTLLATAGLSVVVFAALGNFTLEGFFLALANLADRYTAANADRRGSFNDDILLVGTIALGATMALRRGSLRHVFSDRVEV